MTTIATETKDAECNTCGTPLWQHTRDELRSCSSPRFAQLPRADDEPHLDVEIVRAADIDDELAESGQARLEERAA